MYGSHANVPDYLVRGDSTYRLVTDERGSVRLVVNATTGAVVSSLSYDAWGNVTSSINASFQPFGFAGGLRDDATGLTRFGARDYDPALGRWTAKDPIGFNGGLTNLYGYVGNDPVNWNDAWGFTPDKNYFPHGTKDYYNAQAQNASEYLVAGHGIDGGVSVLQLAKSIKADKNWKRRPVRLLVCKAANWAKELSEDLGGVQVFASYGYVRMGVSGGAGAYAAFATPNGEVISLFIGFK